MRYADIESFDICNGEGIGVSLFVQGCPFHCNGCFNPKTWDFNGGKEWTEETKKELLELIDRPYINHISILGGEALCKENLEDVTSLTKEIKKIFPNKKIWVWSGYKFQDYISNLEILNYIDYVVDGQFISELKDLSLKFRGSSNQQIWEKIIDDKKEEKWNRKM